MKGVIPHWQGSHAFYPDAGTRVVPDHFDVGAKPHGEQFLAWRERMGHVTDVLPMRGQINAPFRASIDRYDFGEFVYSNCYTDGITLNRTIARISQDNVRCIVFNLFLDGEPESLITFPARRSATEHDVGIVAADMDQPMRVSRLATHHVSLFMPYKRLQHVFADPSALHGRVLSPRVPAVRFIMQRAKALNARIRSMSRVDAREEVGEIVDLIANAFGEDAGLAGSKRAISRAMMFDDARRFVHAHLTDSTLTPEYVVEALGMPRPTLYRLFQHEGGLGTYIRHLRLRAAVSDLVRFPGIPVKDIGYSVGFKSASDFTRAFRRAYQLAPQDVRYIV